MSALSVLTQTDPQITLVVFKRCQQLCVGMLQALDPAHVAHKILGISFYWPPFLMGEVLYIVDFYHFLSIWAVGRRVLHTWRNDQYVSLISHNSLKKQRNVLTEFDKKFLSCTINDTIKTYITSLTVQLKRTLAVPSNCQSPLLIFRSASYTRGYKRH